MGQRDLAGVPRTLLLVLRARAMDALHPHQLLPDARACWWSAALPWGDDLERLYHRQGAIFEAGIVVRSYEIDLVVKRHISEHKRPVVIELGAGMSSRFYRVRDCNPDVRWVELDLEDVMALRREMDSESDHHRFVSLSAFDPSWMNELPESDADDVLFVAEGLFMYFEREQVEELLAKMRDRFSGALIVFDAIGTLGSHLNQGYKAVGLDAQMLWMLKNPGEVEGLGVEVEKCIQVCATKYRRWPLLLRMLSILPDVRNSMLVVSGRLKPAQGCR